MNARPRRNRLRVAAAGTGYFSHFHHEAWRRLDRVETVGVASLDLETARSVAIEYDAGTPYADVAAMLDAERPDLLDIITPPQAHLGLIKLAAERGVAVVCQKPFCGGLEAAKQAVSIGKEAGIDIFVHENFRFQPWYREIAAQLSLDLLGDIWQATFRLRPGDGQGPGAYLDRQPYFRTMERFVIHETAVHFVDVFRSFFGEISSVFAQLNRLNPVISGEDAGLVVLNFADGPRGLIDANRLADHAAENRRRTMGEMLIEGEKGALRLDGDGMLWFRRFGENRERQIEFDWQDTGFGGDCVYLLQKTLVAGLLDGSEIPNRAEEYLVNLEVEEAIYRSASLGRIVEVP